MVMIRAHFNGSVLVPDEPLNLPKNAAVRVLLVPDAPKDAPLSGLAGIGEAFGADPNWPADGASQVDHYLYGTQKRAG